jgi:hypothetical protein
VRGGSELYFAHEPTDILSCEYSMTEIKYADSQSGGGNGPTAPQKKYIKGSSPENVGESQNKLQ